MKQLISTCIGVVVMIATAIGEEAPPNSFDGPKEESAISARTLTEHVFEKNAATYYLFDKEIFEQLDKLAQTKPTYPPGTGFSSGEPWAEVLVSGEIPKRGSTETARFSVCVENSYDLAPDESLIFRISSISLSRIDGKSGTTVTSRFGYYEKAEVLDHLLSRICKAAGIALPKATSPNEQLAPRTKAVYSCQDEDVVNNVVRLAKSAATSVTVRLSCTSRVCFMDVLSSRFWSWVIVSSLICRRPRFASFCVSC